jgi:hypothetical protein
MTTVALAAIAASSLFGRMNLALRPKLLAELRPGVRVVSHRFDLGDWKPDRIFTVDGSTVYVWTVPRDPARRAALGAPPAGAP